MKRLLTGLFLIALSSGTAVAMDSASDTGKGPLRSLTEWVDYDNSVLSAGAFYLSLTNHGYIGKSNVWWPGFDPDPCGEYWEPEGQYPKDSESQYLFVGGLWIGAILEFEGLDYPRVSVAVEGWQGDEEFTPASPIGDQSCIDGYPSCVGETLFNPDGWAPQELVSTYTDTARYLPGGSSIDHPFDGIHVPLGLKVKQTSRAFSSAGYDKIAHLEYTIENIGEYTLKDLYMGLYVDADIGAEHEPGNHYEDDITGYRSESGVAYLMDNDGRPETVAYGSEFTCPHVLGIIPLSTPDQEGVGFSYNWWISNGNPEIDFGPAWTDDHSEGFWTESLGTPVTDSHKYFVMKNGEIDYPTYQVDDQSWIETNPQVHIDPETGEETTHFWRDVDFENAPDLADGYDIRCLVSFGPFGNNFNGVRYLEPGDSLTISFAIVFGDSVHDASNPQESNTNLDPEKYDFSDLDLAVNMARELHELADTTPPPPAPYLYVTPGLSGTVVTWLRSPLYEGTNLSIQRRLLTDETGWQMLQAVINWDEYVYVDRADRYGFEYEYRARANRESPFQLSNWGPASSHTIGSHAATKNLSATAGDRQVTLGWDALAVQTVDEYVIWRAFQDSLDGDYGFTEVIGSTVEAAFVDNTVLNGYRYQYYVQAYTNGVLGKPSSMVEALPFGPEEQMLILLHETPDIANTEWHPDSVHYHFANLDWGDRIVDVRLIDFSADTLEFPDISSYDVLWFEFDTMWSPFPYGGSHDKLRGTYLPLYLQLGGHVVASGLNGVLEFFNYHEIFPEYPEWIELENISSSPLIAYMPFPSFYHTPFAAFWEYFPEQDWLVESLMAEADGYETLDIKPERHYFPPSVIPEDYYGTGVTTAFEPREGATVLYSLDFLNQDIEINESPGTLMWHGESGQEEWGVACFGVPLYYLIPDDTKAQMMLQVADDLRNGGGINTEPDVSPNPSGCELVLKVLPNPSNAHTMLHFNLPIAGVVDVKIYNVIGREVLQVVSQRAYSAGSHAIAINCQNLTSGLYFVRLESDSQSRVAKMMLVK